MKRSGGGAVGGGAKRRCRGLLSVGEANKGLKIDRDTFCDVKLRFGKEIFPAHRNVLAAGSKFLAALFLGKFKDSLAPIVDIHEMEPHTFALALDYLYDGRCAVADVNTLQHLLAVASVLQNDALFADVVTALEKEITVDNCASMLSCADHHNLPQLKNKAEAVAGDAFVAVASDPAVPASSMLVLLQSDHLNVNSEEEVFVTLATWLKGQAEPLGEEEQLQMFGLVRFTLLSQDFVDSTVTAEPAFSTLRARNLWLTQFKDVFFGSPKAKQRGGKIESNSISAEDHHQIISWLGMGATTKLERLYCASNDGWDSADFHSKCDNKGPTVTVIKCTDGYVFGGFTSAPWTSENTCHVACADAFIFSLRRPGGVGPIKLPILAAHASIAILQCRVYGPFFGAGDIHVHSGANTTARGTTGICCYELPPGHPPINAKDRKAFFTGSQKFRAAEVEVFRVIT